VASLGRNLFGKVAISKGFSKGAVHYTIEKPQRKEKGRCYPPKPESEKEKKRAKHKNTPASPEGAGVSAVTQAQQTRSGGKQEKENKNAVLPGREGKRKILHAVFDYAVPAFMEQEAQSP